MDKWFTISLDDEARFSPSYATLGDRASTELVLVFLFASILIGTAAWYLFFSILWGWLSWFLLCAASAYVLRTRLSLVVPQPLLRYLRKKTHDK